MPTKVAGLLDSELDAMRLARMSNSERINMGQVEMFAVFNPEYVEMIRVGDTYEPVLRIAGYVDRVVPTLEQMPFDLREVRFDGEQRPYMTTDYHFTREQQAQLVEKGLFDAEFVPPRQTLKDVDLEFKITTDMTIYPPMQAGEAPIVSVDMGVVDRIDTNMEHSGYNMSEYFTEVASDELVQHQAEDAKEAGLEEDMFADLDFEVEQQGDRAAVYQGVSRKQSVRQRLMELSGGQLSFSAEEILDEIQLDDAELVDIAEIRAERERAEMSQWQRDLTDKYNEQVRDQLGADPQQGDNEVEASEYDADLEGLDFEEVEFDESDLDLDDEITTSAESQSKVEAHEEQTADIEDEDIQRAELDFDELDLDDEIDLDGDDDNALESDYDAISEATLEREDDAERARKMRNVVQRKTVRDRVRQAQIDNEAIQQQQQADIDRSAGE